MRTNISVISSILIPFVPLAANIFAFHIYVHFMSFASFRCHIFLFPRVFTETERSLVMWLFKCILKHVRFSYILTTFYNGKRWISWISLTFYLEFELFPFPCQHSVFAGWGTRWHKIYTNNALFYFFFRIKLIHRFFFTLSVTLIKRRVKLRTHVQYTPTHNQHKRKTKTKTSYDWSLVVRVFSFVHSLSFPCVLISFPLHKWIRVSPCHSYILCICILYTNQYLYAAVCCMILLFSQKAIIICYVFT